MQLRHALTTVLFALCCAEGVAGRGAALRKRQEDNTDVVTTAPSEETPPPESSPASTNEPAPTTSAESSPTSEPTAEPTSTREEELESTVSPTSSATQDATPSNTNAAAQATETPKKSEQLPIQPVITPALGLAGVILMGTGIAYCLIGIKHQWLHVYLSAAYSASLGVTVLVVYVMSPPISDAIQGAYFVAAVVTGLIFGALSLVFKEITEGLGCLVGGFCLAMWFMVLRPGGLVQEDTGRAIMIGVFCVVGLSLSFSQYTRNYGLIACTSFAGAQITVLGIDCFSRAGLKEFWLYVWNLNKDIFPLGTNTYPITRGIRVEIAVTVIIAVFGVMSQLKIWKIVKERRDKKEAQRQAEDESRDQLAGEVGQDVEALNRRQLEQWEAMYGDGNKAALNQDSTLGTSVGSTHKKSASVTTREVDAIELEDNPRTAKQSGSKLTNIASRNETEENLLNDGDGESKLAGSATWSSRAGSRRSARSGTSANFTDVEEAAPVQQPGGPEVVPLPFSPPGVVPPSEAQDDAAKSDAGSTKSAETAVTTLNPLALKQLNAQMPSRLPRIEDDRASSIAATADDEPDVAGDDDDIKRRSIARPTYRTWTAPTQATEKASKPRGDLVAEDEKKRERSLTPSGRRSPQQQEAEVVEDEDDEALMRPPTALAETIPRASSGAENRRRDSSVSSRRRSIGSRRSAEAENVDEADAESAVGSLTGHLPEAISKVAMAYRTNEWAKHIADADQPDDLPQEPDSPGVQVDTAFREEAARPVDTKALSEVPVVTPTQGVRKSSSTKRDIKNPYRQSSTGKAPSIKRSSSGGTPVYAFQRSSSQQSMARQSSSDRLRNTPTPLPIEQPLIESPIEETAEHDHFVTPMTSSNNLLDQRNDRLKRKTTTTNFNALNVGVAEESPAIRVETATPDPINISSEGSQAGGEMTLAERKAYIQQQQQMQQQQQYQPYSPAPSPLPGQQPPPPARRQSRRTSNPSPGPSPGLNRMHSTSNPNLIYDSHQPKRTNTVDKGRQSAMYNQWRSSLAQNNAATQGQTASNPLLEEQARQQMISQREAAAHDRQRRQERRAQRESMMDVAMRSGQLHDKHADVLRKMQAKANESAK